MKLNKALYICLPLMGAVMAGCESDVKMDVTPKKGTLLKITAPSLMSEVSGESELPSVVDVYEFADGLYLRTKTINPAEDSVSVTTASSARIFCVSGAQVGNLTTSSTVEEFLSAKISSPKGAQSAPIFYAGASEINVDDTELTLEMRRGVARIDLACADPRIVIKEVIVDNAPAESLIIESETMLEETETVTYSCKIGEDFDGFLEQVFTIFESSQPVTVRVKGTFDGDLMNFATTIPVIKRNKVYTLGVSGGSDMESTVGISDWQPGENGEGLLALGEMAISKEPSI
ncbi:MAG: FimB/Mfa2 family fimbrial subunit, partial [Muribaculaceae bacterium]|nr:FimB/Mfa2 family fimbrial subunit [Muribaculaceae bacterium]